MSQKSVVVDLLALHLMPPFRNPKGGHGTQHRILVGKVWVGVFRDLTPQKCLQQIAGWKITIFPSKYHQNGVFFHGDLLVYRSVYKSFMGCFFFFWGGKPGEAKEGHRNHG